MTAQPSSSTSIDTKAVPMSAVPQVPGQHVQYSELNAKQQEIFNFQKVAATLADYGYACIKLSDDWKGADFLADHFSADHTLRVQLKSALTIDKKYMGRGIHMTFPVNGIWYLVDHDELAEIILVNTNVANTKTWQTKGLHWTARPSAKLLELIQQFALRSPAPTPTKNGKAKPSVQPKGACFVRIGREVVGPMSQTRAAVTAVAAAGDLDLVSMDGLQKVVGAAAFRPVPGTLNGRDLWAAVVREHGLDEKKVKQWAVDQPTFRDGQTWVLQTNVWSKAKLAKLTRIAELTDGEVEIVLDDQSDEGLLH